MSQIIIHAAKINLSRLIARVEAGEEIILAPWLSMGLQPLPIRLHHGHAAGRLW